MSKFQFDSRTGTMVPISDNPTPPDLDGLMTMPQINTEVNTVVKETASEIMRLQRTENPTPICLVDEDGQAESYLDAKDSHILMFRENADYDVYQISDERSGTPLAYIGGYALQIKFNMAELRTMERIEQCLQGLSNLFRDKILNQDISAPNN